MARSPGLAKSFINLAAFIQSPERSISLELRMLIAYAASHAAGCRYCQAHAVDIATRSGSNEEKIDNLCRFEESPLFSAMEKAALRFAQRAASVPNTVTDEDFDLLRRHFSEEQIVDLMAQVALMGWLNRWNDSMATVLEERPLAFAEAHLTPQGWQAGRHAQDRLR